MQGALSGLQSLQPCSGTASHCRSAVLDATMRPVHTQVRKAAYLIEAPHAEAGLASADVCTHEGRLQRGCPSCILRSRLELAQHERRGCAIGWVGRHVRRQVSCRLVGSQRALQWRAIIQMSYTH